MVAWRAGVKALSEQPLRKTTARSAGTVSGSTRAAVAAARPRLLATSAARSGTRSTSAPMKGPAVT